jgi:hypothetical protein
VTALLAERRAFASEPLFPNVETAAASVPDKYEAILAAEWEKVRELRLIKEREQPRFIRPIPAYATDVSRGKRPDPTTSQSDPAAVKSCLEYPFLRYSYHTFEMMLNVEQHYK